MWRRVACGRDHRRRRRSPTDAGEAAAEASLSRKGSNSRSTVGVLCSSDKTQNLFDVVGDGGDYAITADFGLVKNALMTVGVFPGHFGEGKKSSNDTVHLFTVLQPLL